MPSTHLIIFPVPPMAQFAVVIAGVVTGLTGFGFALVSVPFLMLVLPPATVVAAVLAIGEITDVTNALSAQRHIDGTVLKGLLAPAVLGMSVGATVLSLVPPTVLRLTAGVVAVTFASLLLGRGVGKLGSLTLWRSIAGGVSGILATTVGLSGPPIVLFLDAAIRDKHRSRATLAAYFALISPVALALVAMHGGVTPDLWPQLLILTPLALLGRVVGSRLHHAAAPRLFRAITLGVVLIAGLAGVFAALATLLYRT